MKKTTKNLDLSEHVVIITGGGGGLCGLMAEALAGCGANIVIIDKDLQKAEARIQTILKSGGKGIAIETDVTSRQSLEDAYKRAKKEFNRFDILINGAGGNAKNATTSETLQFFDLDENAIRQVFALNCLGTIFTSQIFGKGILETTGEGSIINISSINAFQPLTKIPAYSAAKAGVSNFTQWLAVHMAQNYTPKIRVNGIAPGFFLTEQNRFLLTESQSGNLTERGKTIISLTPAGRFGEADDLISTLLWLISPASEFVTGVIVPIDGGFNAFSGV